MRHSYHELLKTELHLHLEGSVEPETLVELDPSLTPADVDARYRFADFAAFIVGYKWVIERLNRPEDYALIARRLFERLAAERVRYAEVTLSAGIVLRRGLDLAPIYDAVNAEAKRSPVEVRWVFDATRQWGPEAALEVARFAAARAGDGVVAFGLGGDEVQGPIEWFGDVLAFARDAGLHRTIHAGETAGPASIWGALQLGAERIGHGIAAAQDPALLAHLRDRAIPLEVCITSNVATGAVRCLAEHPIRRIYDAGVPIVLGSDDPAMFHTTLTREYDLAVSEFGFTSEELEGIVANGFKYAFSS